MKNLIFLLQIGVGLFYTEVTIAAVTTEEPPTGHVLKKDDLIPEPLLTAVSAPFDKLSSINSTSGVPPASNFQISVQQTPAEDRKTKGGMDGGGGGVKGGKGGKAGKGGKGGDIGTITAPRCCAQTQPNLVIRMNYLPMPTLPPPKKKQASYLVPNYSYQNSYPQPQQQQGYFQPPAY